MGTPNTTILQWVIALVGDPERLAQFQNDSVSVIKADEELEPRQKVVLLSRDPLRIQWIMAYESELDPDLLQMHGIVFIARPPIDE